jgi:hypothetical protein
MEYLKEQGHGALGSRNRTWVNPAASEYDFRRPAVLGTDSELCALYMLPQTSEQGRGQSPWPSPPRL